MSLLRHFPLLLGLWLGFLSVARAQDAVKAPLLAKAVKAREHDSYRFWFDPRRAQPAAAAEIVLTHDPYLALALRLRGRSLLVWNEPDVPDEAPALNPEWLGAAHDRDGKPLPDLRGRSPDEIKKSERDFYSLYNQALANAFWVPASAFAKSARENEDVTFAHLYTEIWKYRGKVIHLEGRLKRLRKYDAPRAAQAKGVKNVFEGWVFLPTTGSHPVCVLFPLLPEGLKPAENMDRVVSFDGYAIFLFRYRSGDGDKKTPLLIAPTLKLLDRATHVEGKNISGMSPSLLYLFVGFVVGVAVLVIGLSWWLRRGDQQVREHLARLRAERTAEMLEDDGPKPA